MNKKKIIVVVLCSIIFIGLTTLYYLNSLDFIDQFFYNIIIKIKSPIVTEVLKFFTMLGGVVWIIVLINIVMLFNRKKGLYFFFNIFVITLLNIILKSIIMRERPIGINLIMETGYSFPSGHSMTSIAAYGLIIYYLYHSKINKSIRMIGILLSCLCALIIPISRVYLGVHYFSDITAGVCLSLIWLMFYTDYLKKKNI